MATGSARPRAAQGEVDGPGRDPDPSTAYAGPDRRHARWPGGSLHAGAGVLAIIGLLAVTASSFGLLGDGAALTGFHSATLTVVLGTAAALSLAMLCAIVWHVDGRASGAWFAGALTLLGLGVVLLDHFPLGSGGAWSDPDLPVALSASSRIVAIVLFALAAVGPEIVSVLRPFRVLLAGIGGVGVLTVAVAIVPGAVGALSGLAAAEGPGGASGGVPPAGSLVVTSLWAGVSVLLVWRSRTRRDPLVTWMAGLAGVLALAEAARWPGVTASAAGGDLLRSAGLALVALGVAGYLLSIFATQRRTVLEVTERSQAAMAQLTEAHQASSELRHEARNALTSIAMATHTLQVSQDRMDPVQRQQLATAVCCEIERLERLLDEQGPAAPAPVSLERALSSVINGARAAGMELTVQVPADVEVLSDEKALGQVVANLLANARRHAPESPVTLRAVGQGGGVALRCEDRGPGVAVGQRKRIFDRGVSGVEAPADSRGLGLNIAARLVRQQGGDIWVEDRTGGGASFVVWLPAPSERVLDLTESSSTRGVAAEGGSVARAHHLPSEDRGVADSRR